MELSSKWRLRFLRCNRRVDKPLQEHSSPRALPAASVALLVLGFRSGSGAVMCQILATRAAPCTCTDWSFQLFIRYVDQAGSRKYWNLSWTSCYLFAAWWFYIFLVISWAENKNSGFVFGFSFLYFHNQWTVPIMPSSSFPNFDFRLHTARLIISWSALIWLYLDFANYKAKPKK